MSKRVGSPLPVGKKLLIPHIHPHMTLGQTNTKYEKKTIVSRGIGSPLPVGENFDSPLNFLPPGSSKTKFPPSEGFRHFGLN